MNSNNNKKRKQPALGIFFQPKPKSNPDGTLIQKIIPSAASNSAQYERTIQCKSEKCTMTFRTTQGLGSHLNTCRYYKEYLEQKPDSNQCVVLLTNMQTIHASGKSVNPNDRRMAAYLELNSTSNFSQEHINVRKDGTIDGRIKNRFFSNRTPYSSQDKWNHIEQFEILFDEKKYTVIKGC